jgi:hypothetical protein
MDIICPLDGMYPSFRLFGLPYPCAGAAPLFGNGGVGGALYATNPGVPVYPWVRASPRLALNQRLPVA